MHYWCHQRDLVFQPFFLQVGNFAIDKSIITVGGLNTHLSNPGLGRSPGGGHGNPLQCSCLKKPWTEEPGGLQSIGSQRVGHNWSDIPSTRARAHTHTHTHTHKICVLYRIKLKINNINMSGKAPQIWKSSLSLPFFICVKEGINTKINILNWINIRK